MAITAFAGAVAIGLLAIGPFVMTALLGNKGFHYGRVGLAVVALGMGLHLVAGTLNQAALARGRAPMAAAGWMVAAVVFVVFVASPTITSEVTRVEVGYFVAALVLCGLLWAVYRRGPTRLPGGAPGGPALPDQPARRPPARRLSAAGEHEIRRLGRDHCRVDRAHRGQRVTHRENRQHCRAVPPAGVEASRADTALRVSASAQPELPGLRARFARRPGTGCDLGA